jgi:NAD(P) transhydrogenase subunit beta
MLTTLVALLTGTVDLAVAFLFMFALWRMSSPVTAASGMSLAGWGMLAAVLASFLCILPVGSDARPHLWVNAGLAVAALIIGSAAAWWSGRKVPLTAMPQLVALYNGMGGGAAVR